MPRGTPEAITLVENNPGREDGIMVHFKNLLRVKKALNGAIDGLFTDYPFLEQEGPDGLTPAQRARKEIEKEETGAGAQLRRVK